jgi:hypothetical protein
MEVGLHTCGGWLRTGETRVADEQREISAYVRNRTP